MEQVTRMIAMPGPVNHQVRAARRPACVGCQRKKVGRNPLHRLNQNFPLTAYSYDVQHAPILVNAAKPEDSTVSILQPPSAKTRQTESS